MKQEKKVLKPENEGEPEGTERSEPFRTAIEDERAQGCLRARECRYRGSLRRELLALGYWFSPGANRSVVILAN